MFKKAFKKGSQVLEVPGCPRFARTPISSGIPKITYFSERFSKSSKEDTYLMLSPNLVSPSLELIYAFAEFSVRKLKKFILKLV